MTCSVLVSGSYVSYLLSNYASDIWKSLQWAEQRAIEKSNRTWAKAAVQYTLTLSLCNSWNESILKLLYIFYYPKEFSVSVSFFACANLYCSILNQILSLNWLMACFKTRLYREFNQPSEDHQIKVTFLLSVLTFCRRWKIYIQDSFNDLLWKCFWNLVYSKSLLVWNDLQICKNQKLEIAMVMSYTLLFLF